MNEQNVPAHAGGFLKLKGEMATRIAGFTWESTPLGPLAAWPQSLRTAVGLVLGSPVPMVLLWGQSGTMIYNDAYSVFAGGRHPDLLGSPVLEGWPEVADFNRRVLEVCLAGGTLSFRDQHMVLYRNGGPEDVWMDLSYGSVPDETGGPAGVLAVVSETTDRVNAEAELQRNRERLSFALNSAGMVGTWDWHIRSNVFYPDQRLAALFSPDPVRSQDGIPVAEYLAAIHPDDLPRVRSAFFHAIRTKGKYSEEYRILGRDGRVHWVIARGECLYDHRGKPVRFPGAIVDISELKESEEARTILMRELNHRVKNIFAVISGLVSMTARMAQSPRDMADALRGRLAALATAHDLIKSAVWGEVRDAERTDLAHLLRRILAPHVRSDDQVAVEGPPIELGAAGATSLALIFHELATNAAKYGALASDEGRLMISWATEGGVLTLEWREEGGPALAGEPAHRGFGSQLIEMSVNKQLRGSLTWNWSGAGVSIFLSVGLDQLSR